MGQVQFGFSRWFRYRGHQSCVRHRSAGVTLRPRCHSPPWSRSSSPFRTWGFAEPITALGCPRCRSRLRRVRAATFVGNGETPLSTALRNGMHAGSALSFGSAQGVTSRPEIRWRGRSYSVPPSEAAKARAEGKFRGAVTAATKALAITGARSAAAMSLRAASVTIASSVAMPLSPTSAMMSNSDKSDVWIPQKLRLPQPYPGKRLMGFASDLSPDGVICED